MALSNDEVRRLARLARLELCDEEVTALGPQVASILDFVQQLSDLDTENVDPMTTALDVENRWRPDQRQPSLSTEQVLQNAPEKDEDCFLVPPVLGAAAAKGSR